MCHKEINLVGKRFGRLVVTKYLGINENKNSIYRVACDCGNFLTVEERSLLNKEIRNCGCFPKKISSVKLVPKYTKERVYGVWEGMIKRCYFPSHKAFYRYGGRGIRVCEEWLNDYFVFREFMYKNGYDEKAPFGECTLDRIDNDGNYEPSNCRIVPMKIQSLNKSNNHRFMYKNKLITVTEAAELNKINSSLVFGRLDKGWDIIKAVETPPIYTNTYVASGQIYTIAEWANIMGATNATIRGRLKTHTMQQIYDEWIENNKKIEVNDFSVKYRTADDITMSHKEWSNKLGICEKTLRKLLKKHTIQEIYDNWKSHDYKVSFIRRGALEVNGIKKTQKEWCKELNISPKCMRKYLDKYTMQEIYDDCVNHLGEIRKNANPPKLHEVNGEIHSQAEWAKILGISASSLGQKLKKYTMQEVYNMHKDHIK